MPVIGHACVGLGAAAYRRRPGSDSSALPHAAPWWTAAVVMVSYLPDVLGSLSDAAGLGWGRAAAHSLAGATLATALATPALARLGRIRCRRAVAIAAFCLFSHVLLDLLAATDRRLWWPFSMQGVGLDLQLIPANSLAELALFGVPCAAVIIWRRRRRGPNAESQV